jgi:ring-1,2-phenylacetyl-CoA epoxidase subunit PaaC
VLEQDIAITNISLDLIGQARNFYQYAATLMNAQKASANGEVPMAIGIEGAATEDSLAYLRDNRQFRNCLLVEQPNGDWAKTILRQYLFSAYQYYLYEQLQTSKNQQLAAIAEKSLKEVTYHLRWSSEWVIRLGDGTKESHRRMLNALDELWTYTGELFLPAGYERRLISKGIAADLEYTQSNWEERTKQIFREAKLPYPEQVFMQTGGKEGKHSEYLGYILADLQFMQRAYPACEW